MEKLLRLSSDQCLLLAVHYATGAKVSTLRVLRIIRSETLTIELALRILLSYLPENIEPVNYIDFIASLTTERESQKLVERDALSDEAVAIDIKPVDELTPSQARKSVKKLHLLPLQQQCMANDDGSADLITRFIIQRVHRIEAETGLLDLVPELVVPFIERSDYLRTWFVSTVLPLLRLNYDFYPGFVPRRYADQDDMPSVKALEDMNEEQAVDVLLSRALLDQSGFEELEQGYNIRRDLRCLVGPWVYGEYQRKRRKLRKSRKKPSLVINSETTTLSITDESKESSDPAKRSDWIYAFKWLVHLSKINLSAISYLVQNWDGPADVDLGGYVPNQGISEEKKLNYINQEYGKTALACILMASNGSEDTIAAAHSLLTRVANSIGYNPVPDLSTSVKTLPRATNESLAELDITASALKSEVLVDLESSLLVVDQKMFSLLVNLIFSAHICGSLNYMRAIRDMTATYFFAKEDEQVAILQQVLQGLVTGRQRTADEWDEIRGQIIWLWSWDNLRYANGEHYGRGVLGKLPMNKVGTEVLKALLVTSCYSVAVKRFVEPSKERRLLSSAEVEVEVIEMLMYLYDNASNGNRTRGNMKKVSDLLAAFRPYYHKSSAFEQYEALVNATHALSFYSLTLQHGVLFQPVNIRVSKDPLLLVKKLLEQNPRSYTKLEDLMEIGNDLVAAGLGEIQKDLPRQASESNSTSDQAFEKDMDWRKSVARRRIMAMTIEASLAENDFETAYSYVMNHLTTPLARDQEVIAYSATGKPSQTTSKENEQIGKLYVDDISWRAAFAAGKYKPKAENTKPTSFTYSNSETATASLSSLSLLHQVNQRIELLSQALILATPPALAEILAVWRRCEEELLAVIAETEGVEDDTANGNSNNAALASMPGTLIGSVQADHRLKSRTKVKPGLQSRTSWNYTSSHGGDDEAPVGLLDVARGAAAAFSRTGLLSLPSGSLQSPVTGHAGGNTRPTSTASLISASGDRMVSSGGAGLDVDSVRRDSDGLEGSNDAGSEQDNDDEATRIRKRDVVANKVTEGLASGIGWVLGAKPVPQ